MSDDNVKWLRDIAGGLAVGSYDVADNLLASAMQDVMRRQFAGVADEIDGLRLENAALKQARTEYMDIAESLSGQLSEARAQLKAAQEKVADFEKWFKDNAAWLASHRVDFVFRTPS